MWDFKDVVAHRAAPRREADLPHGKGTIKKALVYIYAAVHSAAIRRVIEQECVADSAAIFLSKEFRDTVQRLLCTLPEFLPDDEAAVVAWFHSLHVPLPPGPPDTLADRLASVAHACQARVAATDGDRIQVATHLQRWTALQTRIAAEGNAYLAEARTFDRFEGPRPLPQPLRDPVPTEPTPDRPFA